MKTKNETNTQKKQNATKKLQVAKNVENKKKLLVLFRELKSLKEFTRFQLSDKTIELGILNAALVTKLTLAELVEKKGRMIRWKKGLKAMPNIDEFLQKVKVERIMGKQKNKNSKTVETLAQKVDDVVIETLTQKVEKKPKVAKVVVEKPAKKVNKNIADLSSENQYRLHLINIIESLNHASVLEAETIINQNTMLDANTKNQIRRLYYDNKMNELNDLNDINVLVESIITNKPVTTNANLTPTVTSTNALTLAVTESMERTFYSASRKMFQDTLNVIFSSATELGLNLTQEEILNAIMSNEFQHQN